MLIKVSVLFVIGVFAGAAFSASIDCNVDKCRGPMKLFEELQCKPIYGPKSCCPKRFKCADDVNDRCTLDGKNYNIGDVLKRTFADNSKHLETCICSRYDDKLAHFICTPYITDAKLKGGCIKIYNNINESDFTSIVCDEREKEKLAICSNGDVSLRVGEKFISQSNPCYECICTHDFDNTTILENTQCRKLNCDIELKYKSFIQRGCLPIFENEKCCPVDWKCPIHHKSKKVVKRSSDVDEIKVDTFLVTPFQSTEEEDDDDEEEDFSSEEKEKLENKEIKSSVDESAFKFTINVDPFLLPRESEEKLSVEENEETSTEEETKTLIDPSAENYDISTSSTDLTSELITTTEQIISEKEEATTEKIIQDETTIQSATEGSIKTENEFEASIGKDIIVPRINFEAPKFEIPVILEAPKINEQQTTELPELTTFTENIEISSTEDAEIETTLKPLEEKINLSSTTTTTTLPPTLSTKSVITPKLIVKPSIHVIPPAPPSPTEFEKLLTTLKEYVAKLESSLAAAKSAEVISPATYVNYTVSRSSSEEEEEEVGEEGTEKLKVISKRSVLPFYFGHAKKNKEEMECSYGKHQYKVGEKIRTDNECLDCLCLYPPIGHCIRKKKCIM